MTDTPLPDGGDLAAAALYAGLTGEWSKAVDAIARLYTTGGGRAIAALLCAVGDAVAAAVPPADRMSWTSVAAADGGAGEAWAARFLGAYLTGSRHDALMLTSEIPRGRGLAYAGAVLVAGATVINDLIAAGWEPPDDSGSVPKAGER
jgi:hypothetical protein